MSAAPWPGAVVVPWVEVQRHWCGGNLSLVRRVDCHYEACDGCGWHYDFARGR